MKFSISPLCVLFAIFFVAAPASAATKGFNGSGPWGTSPPNWSNLPTGPFNTTFANGDDAVFDGPGGILTVGAVSPGSIVFNGDGYILNAGTMTISNSNTIFRINS